MLKNTKKIKLNIQRTLILLFSISIVLVSCSSEDNNLKETDTSTLKFSNENRSAGLSKLSYKNILNDASILKKITHNAIVSTEGMTFKDQKAVRNYVVNYMERNNTINYLDFNYLKVTPPSNFDFRDYGFSEKVARYFERIVNLNEKADYEGMVKLLDTYKIDLNSDNNLYALSGIFATIEVYKSELLGQTSPNARIGDCPPTGSQIAGGAISGAIGGAITGATWGSFLGPAGTLLGGLGGAIVGSLTSSIISIGVGSILNGDDC
ncbi:hypothetical protein [uncultured Tenacibaculum sp.]|uniref:hypothetical protein n=1 Tax=uncultured Tenacibaculum sp. TaxID=174713 RepID=UPI00262F938F|nr:hypothetical protein [uncultured Tenacibaculum sp.]